MRHGAAKLLFVLQGIRRGKSRGGVQGAIRFDIPEHGDSRSRRSFGFARALLADLLWVFRVRDWGEFSEGFWRCEGWEMDAIANGDGSAISCWWVFRH